MGIVPLHRVDYLRLMVEILLVSRMRARTTTFLSALLSLVVEVLAILTRTQAFLWGAVLACVGKLLMQHVLPRALLSMVVHRALS